MGRDACDTTEGGREIIGVAETYVIGNFLERFRGVQQQEFALLDACLLNILVGCHACLLQENLAEAAVPPVDGDCYILRAYILIIIVVNEEKINLSN